MSDAAFMAAIVAEPRNDTHRLVYADWLDEKGDPRAEFIRSQCAMARLVCVISHDAARYSCGIPTCDYCRHLRRQSELLAAHKDKWLSEASPSLIPPKPNRTVLDVEWKRGFPSMIRCEIGWWLQNSGSILSQHPIERLELCGPLAVDHDRSFISIGEHESIGLWFKLRCMNDVSMNFGWNVDKSGDAYFRVMRRDPTETWMSNFDPQNINDVSSLLSHLWRRQRVTYEQIPNDLQIEPTDQMPIGFWQSRNWQSVMSSQRTPRTNLHILEDLR